MRVINSTLNTEQVHKNEGARFHHQNGKIKFSAQQAQSLKCYNTVYKQRLTERT